MTDDRASIPRLYFEARTLAVQAQAEDQCEFLDNVMEELIAGDITQGEGWRAINEMMGRLTQTQFLIATKTEDNKK